MRAKGATGKATVNQESSRSVKLHSLPKGLFCKAGQRTRGVRRVRPVACITEGEHECATRAVLLEVGDYSRQTQKDICEK